MAEKKDTKPNRAGDRQPVNDKQQYQKIPAAGNDTQKNSEQSASAGTTSSEYSNLPSANRIIERYEKTHGQIKQSGAISGAVDDLPSVDEYIKENDDEARKLYDDIKNDEKDVEKIAAVSGKSLDDIKRVKHHMFFAAYKLEGGVHPFDPNIDQARSWIRLKDGKPEKHDLVMIKHELIESELMAKGMCYDDAHNKANETANYQKALEEYKYGLDKVKKKRN